MYVGWGFLLFIWFACTKYWSSSDHILILVFTSRTLLHVCPRDILVCFCPHVHLFCFLFATTHRSLLRFLSLVHIFFHFAFIHQMSAPGFCSEANRADRSLLVWSTPEQESALTSPQTKPWFVLSGPNRSGGDVSWSIDDAELLEASLNVWRRHFKNAVLTIL